MAKVNLVENEELQDQIRNELRGFETSLISKLKEEFQPKKPEEFLTRNEVAELLKINVNTVDRWSKEGKLIRYGISDRIFYRRKDVEASIIRLK